MKLKAHAKLNLYLEITGKRADGYHELSSQVVFLDLADTLEVNPSDSIAISGSNIEKNIILKTANLLKDQYNVKSGAEFHLAKNIPIGGGLGGGSADAAAALVMLNKLWNLNLVKAELYKIALTLGADVPVCLYSILENKNTAYFGGIGEIISKAPTLPPYCFLLVNPNKPLGTKDVFSNLASISAKKNTSRDFFERTNDLETAAMKLMAEIRQILDVISAQSNCLLARMTGSGATCFGIFENLQHAKVAQNNIKKQHPAWLAKIAIAKS